MAAAAPDSRGTDRLRVRTLRPPWTGKRPYFVFVFVAADLKKKKAELRFKCLHSYLEELVVNVLLL